jgi:hypothetical protein
VLTDCLIVLSLAGQAPVPRIEDAATLARQAFLSHDFAPLFAGSPGVLLHLPGEPMGRRAKMVAAVASLNEFVRQDQEISVRIEGARVVENQFGYVELDRELRRRGVREVQHQRILLSLRLVDRAWRVVEVLLVE